MNKGTCNTTNSYTLPAYQAFHQAAKKGVATHPIHIPWIHLVVALL